MFWKLYKPKKGVCDTLDSLIYTRAKPHMIRLLYLKRLNHRVFATLIIHNVLAYCKRLKSS
jgi:hypothetical protein